MEIKIKVVIGSNERQICIEYLVIFLRHVPVKRNKSTYLPITYIKLLIFAFTYVQHAFVRVCATDTCI